MFTLNLVLKIIITSIMAYVMLNSYLRFHFKADRVGFVFVFLLFLIMVYYQDTEKTFEFFLTSGIVLVASVIVKLFMLKKRRNGYVLLNTYKKEYDQVKKDINKIAEKLKIDPSNICYNRSRPFLLVITNEDNKTANELVKKINKIYTTKKKKLTMYNYWFVIAFLILITILWRF
ncbi:hypothetical protein RJI07_00515 [Mycoplasmatota bacterium WC30]